jgi:dephospho-CoA kinase
MKMIGITGGVGAGKSEILDHLDENPRFLVRKADEIGHRVMEKETPVFKRIIELLGESVIGDDGDIDRRRMAELIFKDPLITEKINGIIHPAVREYVESDKDQAERSGKYDIYFLEAALLIECGYDKICDGLWYIYADPEVRRERLKRSRGYSDEKIDDIMARQLPDEEFRKHCTEIIDNSGDIEETIKQLDRTISGYKG